MIENRWFRAALKRTTVISLLTGTALSSAYAQGTVPAQATDGSSSGTDTQAATGGDIIVTARLRAESLLTVPVTVTALSSADISRYATNDLTSLSSQVPNLVINKSSAGSAGSISLRGIGTAANQAGFEQAVSVNLDGVQTSRGRIVYQGFFDLKQIEVLKGPQALFFGKNSPAGVISLVSADPGDHFEGYVRTGYEFKADEAFGEAVVSGPISDTFGARLAVRARNMKGWMRNLSVAQPVPLNSLGTSDRRAGERELLGRLTLQYKPTSDFTATLKVLASRSDDDGPSNGSIQVTSCEGKARPTVIVGGATIPDPTGDCERDSRFSAGEQRPEVVANWPIANRHDGQSYGLYSSAFASLNLDWRLGDFKLVSTTGYNRSRARFLDTFDGTTFSVIAAAEEDRFRSISQQVRLESDFSGALNFMVGAFYSDDNHYVFNASRVAPVPVDPATGKYQTWDRPGRTKGRTSSIFGQLRYTVDDFELTGGARYTHESKDSVLQQTYVHPAFAAAFTTAKFTDRFRDSNVSPEATISYHPTSRSTIFASYKTGYKSGGLGLSSNLSTATTIDQITFGPEKVKGFEAGAKGELLNGKLRAELTAYTYRFSDLQVTAFNAATLGYTIQNAASVKQKGVEAQLFYQPVRELNLRGAVSYNRNRFGNFFAQCFSGQTAAEGCTPSGQNLGGGPTRASPTWSGNAGFTYDVDLGDAKLGFTGDAYYSSKYNAAEVRSPGSVQNAFWRFNASTRLELGERYELALIGRNLTDKRILLFNSDKPGSVRETYGTVSRPREIVLQGTVHF
jgi:outer membrane receptor protein involved in Fe transport